MTEPHDTQVLTVQVGQEFQIALEAVSGTGAAWYEQLPLGVELVDDKRAPLGGRIGDPVRRVITLRIRQPGDYEIIFELKRVWEPEVRRRKAFHVRVH